METCWTLNPIAFHSNDSHNWTIVLPDVYVGVPLGSPSELTSITSLPGFLGWFTASGVQISAGTEVTEDITDLYAHWTTTPSQPVQPVQPAQPSPSVQAVAKQFGPGQVSEFKVDASVKATVVGVSGLTWCDFQPCDYKGQGYLDADKSGQRYFCFVDSRIMDVEKGSSLTSVDHDWCALYSEMQMLLWCGYVAGYSDEDAVADRLRGNGGELTSDLVPQWPNYVWPNIVEADKFVGELVDLFAAGDVRGTMDVLIDHQSGEREAAAHLVSLVGYALDETKPLTDPTALKGLFVIDSDNDMYNGNGGATAPNSITYCPVSYEWYGGSGLMGLPAEYRFRILNIFGTWGVIDSVAGVHAKTGVTLNRTTNMDWPISCSETSGDTAANVPDADVSVDVPIFTPTGSFDALRASTINGVVIQDGVARGVLQVKVGKASKAGESKVSVSMIGIDGRKYASKAVKVPVGGTPTASFEVKKQGMLTLTFGADGFRGTLNGATVTSVEGTPAQGDGKADFAATDLSSLAGALTDYLPKDETVVRSEKKWTVAAKAGKLKYVKPNAAKGIAGGLRATGANISGLKLTYTPRTQTLKGSFKVWTFDVAKGRLKAVSAKITGIVVNGTGLGEATVKKAVIGRLTVR